LGDLRESARRIGISEVLDKVWLSEELVS